MPEPIKYMESIGSGHIVTGMYRVILNFFFLNIYSLKGPLQKSRQPIILEGKGKEFCSLHFLICQNEHVLLLETSTTKYIDKQKI